MRVALHAPLLAFVLLAGCSKPPAANATAAAGTTTESATPAAAAGGAPDLGSADPTSVAVPATCTVYRDDLQDSDMTMIYYSAAGLPPPIDRWAELALNVVDRSANPEAAWQQAKATVGAQWKAVSGIRCISLRSGASIQRYDPARGGLIVGNFSPGTYYTFSRYGTEVQLRIANADRAGVWKMPADRAEALLRGSGNFSGANILARLTITGARPSGMNGQIEARIDSFDVVPGSYGRTELQTVKVEEN